MSDASSVGLAGLVEAFFDHLERRRKAPSTIKRWRPELARLVGWAEGRELAALTSAELEFGFLVEWERAFRARNGRDPSPNSLRAVVQALSSLFAFATRYELLVDARGRPLRNPALSLESPTIRPPAELDWLRSEQDTALLTCPMSERERIAVLLLRWSGLRVSEATSLRNRDIDVSAETIHVRVSKSDAGYRPIPIVPALRPELERWQASTRSCGLFRAEGPLLVTRTGRAWSSQFVQQLVARVGERAGLPTRLRPHCLRRTFGSHLLNAGVRIEVVSRLLGHSGTAITERCYARLQPERIRAELLAALAKIENPDA